VLVNLAILLPATPARAHVAIRLDVMAPQANQTIGPDSELVVVARPMLLGVPEVSFTATVDGHPLDPATGRVTDQPVPVLIRVNETKRIPLRGLTPGSHAVGVTYKPDRDAPVLHSTVPVTVRQSRQDRLTLAAAALGALLAAVLVVARRRPPWPAGHRREVDPRADRSKARQ
jgi:hypothetical protein